MPPVDESRSVRWIAMLAIWAVAAVFVFLNGRVGGEYAGLLDRQGRRGAPEVSTPLRQVIPARHADAQMWVLHALTGAESGANRVRHTTVDNAPAGREVHWSSAFAWLLRGAAALEEKFGTGPARPGAALERTLLWFNTPLFLAVIVAWSAWAARRGGGWAGVLVACAMLGHQRFREGFEPTYVDHHGLINAALAGLVLGAGFMGFGWWRPARAGGGVLLPLSSRQARRAAMVSGVCGALALWLSASSSLAVIALIGIGGLAAALWQGKAAQAGGACFDPGVWRRWGWAGAGTSALCYLIEYAPGNLGWRLEVNHPLYSLAWWGGAELVALAATASLAGASGTPRVRPGTWRMLCGAAALAAPLIAILLGGSATFMPSDPFVADLRHFVTESRSLPATIREHGFGAVGYDLASALILVPGVWLVSRRRDEGRIVPGAFLIMTGVFVVMACFVIRWWLIASVLQIALLFWLVVEATPNLRWRRVLTLAVSLPLFLLPAAFWINRDHRANQRKSVAAVDLFQPLYRDIAVALRAAQPDGPIVLLASPNVSAGVSYFGRFQSIGTLFWENAPGLRAAAEMWCAGTDDEALRLITARGVTHLVLLRTAPFVSEYYSMLHPGRPPEEAERTFGSRLVATPFAGPRWLQPIPHRVPEELTGTGADVCLFRIAPEQKDEVRLFNAAIAQAIRGDGPAAEKSFLSALETVPATARPSFCGFAGEAAYEQGAHALAVRMLRQGLQLSYDGGMANLTAWILATSSDPAVRDGTAALALLNRLPRNAGDPVIDSTLAATYAELGRFDEAVQAAGRALDAVRKAGGDPQSLSLLGQRLENYRARRPWRQ